MLKTGEMLHPEHPPLGKMLIAAGSLLFGDNPLGWRAASVLAGAVTLTAVLAWSLALLRDPVRRCSQRRSRCSTAFSTCSRASRCSICS